MRQLVVAFFLVVSGCSSSEKGDTGPQGPKGDPGAMGAMGSMGDPGAMGSMGNPGAMGDAGAMGAMGAMGSMGSMGSMGTPGQSVTVTVEAAGTNCANGGVKLVSASGTNYVCNGAPATGAMFSGSITGLPTVAATTGTAGRAQGAAIGLSAAVPVTNAGVTLSPNRALTVTDFSVHVTAATLHSRTIDLDGYNASGIVFNIAECVLQPGDSDCTVAGHAQIPPLSPIVIRVLNNSLAGNNENAADLLFSWMGQ